MSDVICQLQATHTRRSPVFVIGFPCSGTRIACRLLRRYLQVSVGRESQFILRYVRQLSRFGDLTNDNNVRRLLYEINTEGFFARSRRNCRFEFDVEKVMQALTVRTYAGVLHTIFGQLARHNGMDRWGDEMLTHNSNMREIWQLFPDAQFIHVVRDGRNVALSVRNESFGPKNACETASDWTRAIDSVQTFSSSLPRDQFFELRYEDLTERTVDVAGALADFLGIDDRDGSLHTYLRVHVEGDIWAGNSGSWHQTFSTRDVERFEGVAGDTLAHFGYHLAYQGHARPVSALEQRYWKLRGRTDRWLMRVHRNDNPFRPIAHAQRLLSSSRRGSVTTHQTDRALTTR